MQGAVRGREGGREGGWEGGGREGGRERERARRRTSDREGLRGLTPAGRKAAHISRVTEQVRCVTAKACYAHHLPMYDPCMHSAGEGVNAIVRVLLSVAPLSRAHFIPLLCPPERAMLGGCTIDTLAFPPTPHSHSHLTWSPTAGVQSSMAWTACIYSRRSVP